MRLTHVIAGQGPDEEVRLLHHELVIGEDGEVRWLVNGSTICVIYEDGQRQTYGGLGGMGIRTDGDGHIFKPAT